MPVQSWAERQPKVIVAVVAHPDDEIFFAPVLARYARDGAKVYVAVATKGEKGSRDPSKLGAALATLRRQEETCSSGHLGLQQPIFFELNDGELGVMTRPLGVNIRVVAEKVQELISTLRPQVLITWGPDGGYGHPDHRLVSDAVTEVIQASKTPPKLFYVAFNEEQAKVLTAAHISLPWHVTDASYLTTRVAFNKADQDAFHEALRCYPSQYDPDEMDRIEKALDAGWAGTIWLRPWNSSRRSHDLFR
jgi:LmbE family N-acetylglucosaminyl deacetylase